MYHPLNEVYKRFSEGEIIIVFDEHREGEGDFFCLGEYITPEKINFFLKYGKGMITVPCTQSILQSKNIPRLCEVNECPHSTNYALPVDAKHEIRTGVNAQDRSKVIQLLSDPKSLADDFTRPGHTTPLIAQDPNTRFGHTEASVEMAKKCQKTPVVAICEILNEEGSIATKAELLALSKNHGISIIDLETIQTDILPL